MRVYNFGFIECIFFIVVRWMYFCDAVHFNQLKDNENTDEISNKVQMVLYDGSPGSGAKTYNYKLYNSKELINRLDLSKPYVLYIHGYEEEPSSESIRTIVAAHLQRGTDNIVLLDWSALAFDNYLTVYLRMKDIARRTAKAIESLVLEGLNVDAIHVVGHSMGAQVAGYIGRYLNFQLPRVTGLDPANPLFYQFGSAHISESSARQVDVIHTDGGLYGAYENTGSVDFFPNGGIRPQPGCHLFGIPLSSKALCSHWRSWRFYAESVVNNKAFPTLQCDSYGSFLLGHCNNNKVVYMGYALPTFVTGTFFLQTNNASRFGRGFDGIRMPEGRN